MTDRLQGATPRETDALDETVQEHIRNCQQCTYAINDGPPRGFGQKTRMCKTYLQLVQMFADGRILGEGNPT